MKKLTLIAAFAIALISCEKEEIKLDDSSNYLKTSNCLNCNSWQLVYTYKNEVSTIADSSIWTFNRSQVQINNSYETYSNLGTYLSVGGENGFKSTIIKLDNNNMELLKNDSTVLVFDQY